MKRFIAGVVCPKCKEVDSIYLLSVQDTKKYRCVACDFTPEIDQIENNDKSKDAETATKNKKLTYDSIRIIDS